MLCKTIKKIYNAAVYKNCYGGKEISGWTGEYVVDGTTRFHDMSDFLSYEQAQAEFNRFLIKLDPDDCDNYDDYDYDEEDEDYYD